MNYLKKYLKYIILIIIIFLAFNLYFIFLIKNTKITYLLYLDLLILVGIALFTFVELINYRSIQKTKNELLKNNWIIYHDFINKENFDILQHDIDILEQELQNYRDINSNLQDYIAKSFHEIKIPLATLLLMNEKITDSKLKTDNKDQLERINQLLNTALIGSKIQSDILDIHIKAVNLLDCIKTSIKNNQFFLIRKHFELDIQVEDLIIYTDKQWLVYILDQIINNAIKYAKKAPVLKIYTQHNNHQITVYIEDNGEGIKDSDIKRIYERGFTGSNHHNGKYKSTGMGLYMVATIIERLGYSIDVESQYGVYSKFKITIKDNREFFNL